MNTKLLMSVSALFLAVLGISLSFLPDEIAEHLGVAPNAITLLFLKLLSALFMGFGIANWMLRRTRIGGIYNRPIVLGNIMHFGVGAVALAKTLPATPDLKPLLLPLAIVYGIFAMLFLYIFRSSPV